MTKKRRIISSVFSLMVIVGIAILIYSIISKPAKAAWWNDSWSYRQKSTITNSGSAQTDFQVSITMDTATPVTAGKMQSDCDDIRLTDNTGNLLPIWLEPTTCNGASTKFWTKIPAIPVGTSTVYIYYGNAAATSISNAEAVFIQDIDQVQGAWTLDESSGTRADSSGNGYTLTDNATVGSTTGQYSNAARFVRTSSEYLSRADNANLSINDTSFSVAFWVRFTTIANTMTMVSKQHNGGAGEYRVDFESVSGKIQGYAFNSSDTLISSVGDSQTISTSTWYHVVFGFNKNINKLYLFVNGTLSLGSNLNGVIPDSTDEFRLGQSNGGSFLDGDLDEVTFYKQAITDSERINDLKNTSYRGYFSTNYANHQLLQKYASTAPSSGTPASEESGTAPIAYWKMDEGTDNTCSGGTNDVCNAVGVSSLDGAITGTSWKSEDQCISGKCVYMDGSGDNIKITNGFTNTIKGDNTHTISFWVKVNGLDTFGNMLIDTEDSHDDYFIQIGTGGQIYWTIDSFTRTYTYPLSTGTWYYLTFVKTGSGDSGDFYVNGLKQGNYTGALTSTPSTNSDFLIGQYETDVTFDHKGYFDDFKIYNYSRTVSQIKADYASAGVSKGGNSVLGANKNSSPNALSNGLAGYWTLDEASGNATDYSGNGSTLTDTNTVTRVNGKFGNAGDFQNSDDLRVSDNASLSMGNIDFTISTWVNLDSKATSQPFIAKGASGSVLEYLLFYYVTSDTFRFAVQDSGASNTCVVNATTLGSPSTGTWYFLSAWHDSVNDTLNIQVNDGKVDSQPCSTGSFDGTNSFFLGNIGNNATFLDGKLDDVRVYKRILSNTDRLTLYNWAPGPIGYWKIDEGTGSSAYDTSTNGNTGTKTNGSWGPGKYGGALSMSVNSTHERISAGDVAAFDFSDTQSFSFVMWVKRTNAGSIMMLSKGGGSASDDGYDIETSGSAASCYYTDGNASGADQATGTTNILDGVWHHIFCVMDRAAGTYAVYVDGVKEGTDSSLTEGSAASNTSSFIIGEIDASSEIEGSIDDVRIYNYARNIKQIMEDIRGGNIAPSQPLGYWKLDEGADNTCSGGSNDTCNSGTAGTTLDGVNANMASPATSTSGWTNSGKFGRAVMLDGINDTVVVTDTSVIRPQDGSWSVTVWAKPANSDQKSPLVAKRQTTGDFEQWSLSICGDISCSTSGQNLLGIFRESDAIERRALSIGDVADGQWHHYAMVADKTANKVFIYMDGKEMASTLISDSSWPTINNTDNLRFGSDGTNNYSGPIDEVKIFNYSLTADEIKTDYNHASATSLGGILGTQDSEGFGGTDPIVYWPFDENTGTSTTSDKTGNANTGTLNSITAGSWVPGRYGSALYFDGAADYVSNSDLATSLTGDLTISMWFKASSAPSTQRRIADLAQAATLGLQISMSATGTVGIDNTGGPTGSCFSSATYIDNKWHFVQVTRSSTTYTVYIDGGAAACTSGGTAPTYDDLYVGTEHPGVGTSYFPGAVDDVLVYNYVRTGAQRAYDFNRGAPMGHYKFDECQGTTAYNSAFTTSGSGSINNGTITTGATGTYTSAGTCDSGTSTHAWYGGVTGKINNSLGLDGTDDYVTVTDPTNGELDVASSQDFTVSAWIKTSTAAAMGASQGRIVSKRDNGTPNIGYELYVEATETRPSFVILDSGGNTVLSGTANVADAQWHHLVAMRSGSNVSIYVDGKRNANGPTSRTGSLANSTNFYIGQFSRGDANRYWPGQVDEVRFYNYALTDTQVKILYNNGAVFFGPATGAP